MVAINKSKHEAVGQVVAIQSVAITQDGPRIDLVGVLVPPEHVGPRGQQLVRALELLVLDNHIAGLLVTKRPDQLDRRLFARVDSRGENQVVAAARRKPLDFLFPRQILIISTFELASKVNMAASFVAGNATSHSG